jgi:excisionase family DNA binding protein
MSASLDSQSTAALLGVRPVAALLDCSVRHVYRMCDAGKMPPPVRLGALVRWNRTVIDQWIAAGCPSVRAVRTRRNLACRRPPSVS